MEAVGLIERDPADATPRASVRRGAGRAQFIARPARHHAGVRWAVCVAFATVLTLLILQYSFNHGRLILYPTYDDCGYMVDGLMRVQMFYDYGWLGVGVQYLAYPPHSPYSTFMASLGFALFGSHDWAPYV